MIYPVFVLYFLLFITHNLDMVVCRRGRILNGTQAALGLFASQVQIRLKQGNLHKCGGTLIEESHVLTAAVCVDGLSPSALSVMAGDVSLYETTVSSRQFRDVNIIIIHPNYNTKIDRWAYNVAVLKLLSAFRVNRYLEPVAMLTKEVSNKTVCYTPGWGVGAIKNSAPKLPHVLYYADLYVVDILSCGHCAEKTMCAMSPAMEQGGCELILPFTCNRELAPVQMATPDKEHYSHCFTPGWGVGAIKDSPPKFADVLYYAEIFIVDIVVCGHCAEKTMCAMSSSLKEGPCSVYLIRKGDEGGGLYCNGYLRGVYAGSFNECTGAGATFSDVILLRPWIQRILVWEGDGEIPLPVPEGRRLPVRRKKSDGPKFESRLSVIFFVNILLMTIIYR